MYGKKQDKVQAKVLRGVHSLTRKRAKYLTELKTMWWDQTKPGKVTNTDRVLTLVLISEFEKVTC